MDTDPKLCDDTVWMQGTRSGRKPCPNKAKYGDHCGVHSAERQAARRKARGPSVYERATAKRRAADDLARRRKILIDEVVRNARATAVTFSGDGYGTVALQESLTNLDKFTMEHY